MTFDFERSEIIIPDSAKTNLVKIGKITEDKGIIFLSFDRARNEFPESVINYVTRTQETIILNNASAEGQYTKDLYIVDRQVKSALCLPMISQGNFIGVLYLENNLSTNIFKKDSTKVLEVIVNRGAVAIENAILKTQQSNLTYKYRVGGCLSPGDPSYVIRAADLAG